jgi:hypothetical protein
MIHRFLSVLCGLLAAVAPSRHSLQSGKTHRRMW